MPAFCIHVLFFSEKPKPLPVGKDECDTNILFLEQVGSQQLAVPHICFGNQGSHTQAENSAKSNGCGPFWATQR